MQEVKVVKAGGLSSWRNILTTGHKKGIAKVILHPQK
jgi:hypothetical protein